MRSSSGTIGLESPVKELGIDGNGSIKAPRHVTTYVTKFSALKCADEEAITCRSRNLTNDQRN